MNLHSPIKIEAYANEYNASLTDGLVKTSFIKKLPSGKWTILSEKGKHLGTYDTKQQAVKRLKQIEWFKSHKKEASSNDESYSATMRELRKSYDDDTVSKFQQTFKDAFDAALIDGEDEPESFAMSTALETISADDCAHAFNKTASAIDLGDPQAAGKYLADLIRFLLRRISPERRKGAIDKMKKKIYYVNEYQIAGKKTPNSSSMGQSLTLIKTILLEHSPEYIRAVLNGIVRHL